MTVYNFPMTLDRQFKNQLEHLHDKYGDEMLKIEGMSPNQLDTCNFFKNVKKTGFTSFCYVVYYAQLPFGG